MVEHSVNEEFNKPPLVTYILLCYKQEQYIRAAVHSAFEQDYDNIEFIISDDKSPDSSFELIKSEVEKHGMTSRVILNRNENNLGLVPHFNKLLAMAKGEIIVVAAGDDISIKDRVSKSVAIFEDTSISFVSFNDDVINAAGEVVSEGQRVTFEGLKKYNLADYISGDKIPFSGASRAFRRTIYDYFGDLNQNCPTEDTPYIIRCLLMGNGAVTSDIGIKYRVHGQNISGPQSLPNLSIDDITNQYLIDVNAAFDKDIINSESHQNLTDWIHNYNQRTNLHNGLLRSKLRLAFLFSKILLEKCFSREEKILYLKLILKNKYAKYS